MTAKKPKAEPEPPKDEGKVSKEKAALLYKRDRELEKARAWAEDEPWDDDEETT